MNSAWVLGGGFAAACTCYALREEAGVTAHVFEREPEWGGLVRSRRLKGVIYEPHGSHIFHTDDDECWEIVSGLVPFNRYEHTVTTMVRGRGMTWPIQADEIIDLYGYEDYAHHQAIVKDWDPNPEGLDFESWCLQIMSPSVYDDFVAPYTEKQWGRPASELSADFAPKRVQVREDGDKRLFKDGWQGYPDGRLEFTWEDLMRELFGRSADGQRMHTNTGCTLEGCVELLKAHPPAWRPELIVVTVPLDDFCNHELGRLSWRGLRFEAKHVNREHVLPTMVVNYPDKAVAWIRQHEAKHASGQRIDGTVVVTEFPGGPGRYYPVPGRDGVDRKRNASYIELVTKEIEALGPKVIVTGRLATFRYLDTDEVLREALDAVRNFVRGGDTVPAA